MIDDFYTPAWADAHEKFGADLVAGLARLARRLRPRDAAKDGGRGKRGFAKHQPMPESITIASEAAIGADAQYCLSEYYRELQERFDGGFDPGLSLLPSLDEFAPPRGMFLLVRLNGQPVGCGGLKPISKEAAYLKRMWIASGARGRGLARRLLSALEDDARVMGYSIVRLETNKSLIEAQQLYRSSGYREVAPFNDERYAHHWFEKRLDRISKR
ncbi:GNAT family N-acetyltransferase [Sphingomonas sp.]|uniref:GNAT family N-acetyltransferase n=1 Tax=Sphingomonas sp. TaxID=28214 RepID=UPI0038ADB7BE